MPLSCLKRLLPLRLRAIYAVEKILFQIFVAAATGYGRDLFGSDQLAAMKNTDPVADLVYIRQEVRVEENRLSLLLQLEKDQSHVAPSDRVQSVGGLIPE